MAPDQQMTEYERRRLENIKRNAEMLASLNVQSHLSDLSATHKRQRVEKSYKSSERKEKQTLDAPVVIRRSLRTQGKPPDSFGLPKVIDSHATKSPGRKHRILDYFTRKRPVVEGPISLKEAYDGDGSYRAIVEKFTTLVKSELHKTHGGEKRRANVDSSSKSEIKGENMEEPRGLKLESQNITKSQFESESGERRPRTRSRSNSVSATPAKIGRLKPEESNFENLEMSVKFDRVKLDEPIDLKSFKLESDNIARVAPGRIYTVRFLPTTETTMVVTGNMFGHVSFWDVKEQSENDVIHLYQPHSAPVSGISMHPFSLSKVYTSSYDGFLRMMNIEREEFDLAYSSSTGSALFSVLQQPNNAYSVYFGEGQGNLNMIDARVGEITNSWPLHGSRISTIDFNPANENIMATSSSDGFAHVWDLRKMHVRNHSRTALQSVFHERVVYSAYFSPSGTSLATTSADNNIGLLCGVNFEDKFMIPHDNWVNRWVSPFRATWGWDDNHLFVGNMKRCVDVVCVDQKKIVRRLESPLMTAIPCLYDAHPHKVGMLAGATSGGQVYMWTTSS